MDKKINSIIKDVSLYGKKIYLVGTSEYGPVNVPLKVTSINQAVSIFGNKGSLIDAYKTILASKLDCEIFFVKTTGIHSEVYLSINQPLKTVGEKGLYIKSKNANEMYNNLSIKLEDNSFDIYYSDIYNPSENYSVSYSYDKYISVYDLAEGINNDTRNLKNDIYCVADCDTSVQCYGNIKTVNQYENRLSGGNSGLFYSKNMLYTSLDETLSLLEGYDIDILVPLNACYDDTMSSNSEDIDKYYDENKEYLSLKKDDKYLSFYSLLLDFCIKQMANGLVTTCIMGMRSIEDFNEDKYIEMLKHFNKINTVEDTKEKYKHLITVVVGELYSMYGINSMNGYIAYAPLVASINVTENTTNKKLPSNFMLKTKFTSKALEEFRHLGFTSFRYNLSSRAVVVTNGITTSSQDDLKYLCNVRMIQLTMLCVRKLLSSLIGINYYKIIENNELYNLLLELMRNLTDLKVLDGYEVNTTINSKRDHVFVDLSLKTIYMIESIKTQTGVELKGGDYIG